MLHCSVKYINIIQGRVVIRRSVDMYRVDPQDPKILVEVGYVSYFKIIYELFDYFVPKFALLLLETIDRFTPNH